MVKRPLVLPKTPRPAPVLDSVTDLVANDVAAIPSPEAAVILNKWLYGLPIRIAALRVVRTNTVVGEFASRDGLERVPRDVFSDLDLFLKPQCFVASSNS